MRGEPHVVMKRTSLFDKLRLPLGILLALIPLLIVGGGAAVPARANLPTQGVTTSTGTGNIVVMRIYFRDAAERDRLATELGAEESSTTGGYLTLWSDMARYNSLVARGLNVVIDQKATEMANEFPGIGTSAPGTFYGGYRTVEEMQAFLDAKVASYPDLTEKVDIGDSWCKTHPGQCTQPNAWNGFDLWVMHITNRSIPGPKPVFWYDAGIHSREIATPEVAMRFIDYLLNNYGHDADATWLVDWHDIWVMPMLNPDGHHMNESNGEGTPTLHRKNADRDDGCTTYDQFGTDINRNFPFLWGCCGGSSGNACSETYRGPAAESEEETQALAAKVRQLIPDQRGPLETDAAPLTTTGTLINMHSNAAQNLYPWGYTSQYAPNRTDLRNIGRHMSSQQVVPVGNNYEYCQNTECLYIVDGDEKNWAYGELGIPGYSLELSGSGFFPRYACLDNPPGVNGCNDSTVGIGLWPQNKGALLHHAKIVRAPYLLTRGPDVNNPVTTPMTVTQGTPSLLSATINYNWSGSDAQPNAYLQNVLTAEYYIDTPPWAGGTPVAMQATDGAYDETTEAVEATISTGSIPVGRHIIFVRGRGVNDYEGLGSWGPVSATWLTITPPGGPTPTPTALGCGIDTYDVSIIDFGYEPQIRLIRVGSTVRWTNNGQVPHTTTSNTGVWDSGVLNPGEQFAITFNMGTVFEYHCTLHPNMTATIVVVSNCPTVTLPVPTATRIPSATRTGSVPVPTSTSTGTIIPPASPTQGAPTATPTPTACTITFTDVPVNDTFYPYIRCLACRGILGGYADGTFRPGNNVTRGQISKIVSNAAGFNEPIPPTQQTFEDVPPNHTFWVWIERLASRGIIGGYPCGGTGEPCIPPDNRPYFRPQNNTTRAQLTKIICNTVGCTGDPGPQRFEDVPPSHQFYAWIQHLAIMGVIGGYPCGGTGEPCGPLNLPYFRPGNYVTRGQTTKIVADTFFPDCQTP